jgi:uncharacterized Zn finger protein
MRPTGWTAECLWARCDRCGASQSLSWHDYFTALDTQSLVQCHGCGEHQQLHDRRQRDVSVASDRRASEHLQRRAS